jgi:hypothetical protein
MNKLIFSILLLVSTFFQVKVHAQEKDCLFKNPLCFYNTDILSYLQVLHKNQQYEQMLPYITGPAVDGLSKEKKISKLEDASFGYQMKRQGVKTISNQEWGLTYSRIIMGTQETFKIKCLLVKGTCCVYLDEKRWKQVFR